MTHAADVSDERLGIVAAGPLLGHCISFMATALALSAVTHSGVPRIAFGGVAIWALVLLVWSRRIDWATIPLAWVRVFTASASLAAPLLLIAAPMDPVVLACIGFAVTWLGQALPTRRFVYSTAATLSLTLLGLMAPASRPSLLTASALILMLVTMAVLSSGVRENNVALRQRAEELRLSVEQEKDERRQLDEEQRLQAAQRTEAELVARARLIDQIAVQTQRLNGAVTSVSGESQSVAHATGEMTTAIAELARTAQATQDVSESVAAKAGSASGVIERLAVTSEKIMSASLVIQQIAQQTNLLALNATIESARAGEAGRGFAVVAQEVKELAQQSEVNADQITETVNEVLSLVRSAVDEVRDIGESMGELRQYNGTLAAAIEEQLAMVSQIDESVSATAHQISEISSGVTSLEQLTIG